MRYIKYLFLGVLAVVLITVAVANRQMVTLSLLPEAFAAYTPFDWRIDVPLFVVVFTGILAGLLIGFFWEWLREHKHRNEASRVKRDTAKLEREVNRLKRKAIEGQDDVLALLEDGGKAG